MPGLAGYLQQEGLLEEVPDAIVDSGWVGSMQMALNEVLASMGRTKPLEGYYWGLYARPLARTVAHTIATISRPIMA